MVIHISYVLPLDHGDIRYRFLQTTEVQRGLRVSLLGSWIWMAAYLQFTRLDSFLHHLQILQLPWRLERG